MPDTDQLPQEREGGEGFTPGQLAVWPSLYEGFAASVVADVEPLQTLAQVRHYKDAVLYAAAPDLLAALGELNGAVRALAPHFNAPAVEHAEKWLRLDAAQKATRAAIAKALGHD